ncbi:MAG: protoporphyrinogen oxidase [Gemmataceae bacterium]
MAQIVILGAGISGLSLAFALQQRRPDAQVHVWEAADRAGGKIASHRREGFLVEHGPNGFLDNNPATLNLCRDLGLESRLISASEVAGKNRYLLLNGQLQQLPNSLSSFLFSGLLSWRAKLNLLFERFQKPGSVEEESIDAFARRRVGDEIAHTFADAFVTGILAGDPQLLSFQASFPRLAAMEREYGSLTRGLAAARKGKPVGTRSRMWSFPDGLQELIDALVARLRLPLRTRVTVRSLQRLDRHWIVQADPQTLKADIVVLACPASEQARLLQEVDAELAREVGAIAYNRVGVVALGYHRSDVPHALNGFGYLTPQRERLDALGVQWCSSIFPEYRAPRDQVLLRVLVGGWNRPDLLDREDSALLGSSMEQLRQTLGITAKPHFYEIIRWNEAIPQYFVGHLARLRKVDQRLAALPGLYLAGNAYRGVAINDCVESGRQLAEQIVAKLALGDIPRT